jgi:hypothetical protein
MSINGALSAPVDLRRHFSIRLADRAKAPPLRQALSLIKVPDRFLNMLAQEPPLIRSHHAMPWRPLGRLRIAWRQWHGRYGCLRVAIPVEWLLHAMLSTHEAAVETLSRLL